MSLSRLEREERIVLAGERGGACLLTCLLTCLLNCLEPEHLNHEPEDLPPKLRSRDGTMTCLMNSHHSIMLGLAHSISLDP